MHTTPKEKAIEIYNMLELILNKLFNYKEHLFVCMDLYIAQRMQESYDSKKKAELVFWTNVKAEKEKLM